MGSFDGVRRALLVHAHPDDESIDTAGLIALLRHEGSAVSLVTATRGERGEVAPGPLKALEGTPALAEHRADELAAAMRVLDVADHRFLGAVDARAAGLPPRRYLDSGMVWGPDGRAAAPPDSSPLSFTRAHLAELVPDLLTVVDAVEPEVVVSYDADGGYGHPDHVLAGEIAREAAAIRGIRFVAIVKPDAAQPGDELLDITAVLPQKRAALAAHATQLVLDPVDAVETDDEAAAAAIVFTLSGGQRQTVPAFEAFRAE